MKIKICKKCDNTVHDRGDALSMGLCYFCFTTLRRWIEDD